MRILLVLALLLMPMTAYAGDTVITLTIPEAKVSIALEGFLKIYPNSEMTDDETPVAKYTNAQWVKEKIRQIIVRDIRRGLQMSANENAQVASDDNIVN